MCGFYGHIIINQDTSVRETNIDAINDSLYNRGPDSKGLIYFDSKNFSDTRIGSDLEGLLLFRRLAIQDLDDRSNQPFLCNKNKIGIVFNGEIYNFKELRDELSKRGYLFKTKSDTEVVINSYNEWGKECFNRFRGMFAIVIVDLNKRKLVISRDHFGIKPLYFYSESGVLRFGSNILSILSANRNTKFSLNEEVIKDFARTGVAEKYRQTSFTEIYKVDPAEHIEIDFLQIESLSNEKLMSQGVYYWTPLQEKKELDFDSAVKQTQSLLTQSIKRHMVADVPITNTLSGGIDSSSILALASELNTANEPIISFGYINEDVKEDNEEIYMETARQRFGSELRKITVDQEYFNQKIDDFLATQFEPVTNLSPFAQYAVYEKISSDGFKVALDGQGADEVYLGYGKHLDTYLTYLIQNHKFLEVRKILRGSDMGKNTQSQIMVLRIKNAMKAIKKVTSPDHLALLKDLKNLEERKPPNSINIEELFSEDVHEYGLIPNQKNLITLQEGVDDYLGQRLEFFRSGLQQLLSFEDKNAMRFSVENRVPFLDVDIYESTFAFPPDYLISEKGLSKFALREAMKNYLPESILQRRRKLGLTTPMFLWNKFLESRFMKIGEDDYLSKANWINQKALQKIKEEYISGIIAYGNILFRLFTISEFHKNVSKFLR